MQHSRSGILYQLQLGRASLRDSGVKCRGPGGKSNKSMCMEDNVKLILEILLSSKEQVCVKKISNSLFSVFRGGRYNNKPRQSSRHPLSTGFSCLPLALFICYHAAFVSIILFWRNGVTKTTKTIRKSCIMDGFYLSLYSVPTVSSKPLGKLSLTFKSFLLA